MTGVRVYLYDCTAAPLHVSQGNVTLFFTVTAEKVVTKLTYSQRNGRLVSVALITSLAYWNFK